jgi:hypothetical protein
MGLFTAIATLPLAPVRGVAAVAELVADEAERQLHDESRLRRELLQLELDHDMGAVHDDEYAARADALVERITGARETRSAARSGQLPEEPEDG